MLFLVLLLRLFVAVILFAAGWAKVRELEEFTKVVLAFEILPSSAARLLARGLPWGELGLAVLLSAGLWIRAVAILVALLLSVFGLVIAVNLMHGRELKCGCFGSRRSKRAGWDLIMRNGFLISLLVPVFMFDGGAATLGSLVPFLK